MGKHPTRRGYFLAALAGVLTGTLLVSVIPAVAGNGEPLVLGEANKAGRSTWLASQGPSVLKLNNTAGNVALDLRVQPGAAPLAVDSPKRVVDLNADRLDGRHARELIRVAYAETNNAPETASILSTEITAPQAGFLIMSASVDSSMVSSYDDFACGLKVDGSYIDETLRFSIIDYAGAGHTRNSQENCSTTGVNPVDAGTHTVTFAGSNLDDVNFGRATLWALYVPFDGTGATP